jgi:hypothetical protein
MPEKKITTESLSVKNLTLKEIPAINAANKIPINTDVTVTTPSFKIILNYLVR